MGCERLTVDIQIECGCRRMETRDESNIAGTTEQMAVHIRVRPSLSNEHPVSFAMQHNTLFLPEEAAGRKGL